MIGKVPAPPPPVVIGHRFPRQRCGERHGEPVEDLRVGLGQDDFQRLVSVCDHAFDAAGPGVLLVRGKRGEPLVGPPQLDQPFAEVGKAQHLREAADDGTVDGGVGDAR